MNSDAVRNNAEWCDLVCRANGLATRWNTNVWKCERRSPPFYPDAVTLSPAATAAEVLTGIDSSAGCSIKDSFACLEFEGFRILFEAQWIRRAPRDTAVEWKRLESMRAWPAIHPDVFANPSVTALGAYEGDTLVGGAIANLTGSVVGISNVFGEWARAADAVSGCFPGVPIVGYESGAELDAALGSGFEATGPLRVWLRD